MRDQLCLDPVAYFLVVKEQLLGLVKEWLEVVVLIGLPQNHPENFKTVGRS